MTCIVCVLKREQFFSLRVRSLERGSCPCWGCLWIAAGPADMARATSRFGTRAQHRAAAAFSWLLCTAHGSKEQNYTSQPLVSPGSLQTRRAPQKAKAVSSQRLFPWLVRCVSAAPSAEPFLWSAEGMRPWQAAVTAAAKHCTLALCMLPA